MTYAKKNSLIVSLLAATFLMVAAPTVVSAEMETHKPDAAHSQVMFRANHLDIGYTFGHFMKYDGTIKYNTEKPSESSIELTIETPSVETFVDKRDKHLRGPDFLSAKKFPEMTFKSTKVAKKDDETLRVTGDLTIRDTTKQISIDVKKLGEGKGPEGNFRRGWYTEFDINRLDYGVDWNPKVVGKKLRIIMALETVKQ